MAFDIGRLRRGEQIAAAAAVLLFILMFLDWYHISVNVGPLGDFGGGLSAWKAFDILDIYLFVVILAAIGLAFLTATERTPALPVTASVIVTALAGLGTLVVVYRLINVPGDVPDGIDVGRTIWAFLGLAAVAAITYGGYLSMREEGTSFSDARDQARAAFDSASSRDAAGGGTSAPPPPPSSATEPPAAAPPPPPPPAAASPVADEAPAASPAGDAPPASTYE